jgi:inosose dehydratase
MTVRLGINPIGWTNDCMAWLGDFIPPETLLSEARAAGFSGVELGRKFPREARKLKALLGRHDLSLVSGWYSARLLERNTKAEIAAMSGHLALMKDCGAKVMVFAETTGDIVLNVAAGFSQRPKITSAAQWKGLGQRMTEVADHMLERGVRMAVHHHMGTPIESATDVDRLMENTGPSVGLLLDTGHMTVAGGNPVAVARKHAARIRHVHCKDVRRYALEACRRRDTSFTEAVLCGLFTAPGDGIVDFAKILTILSKEGYKGWLVQEAEQDPRIANPRIYAELGNGHLRKAAAAAGLRVAER